MKQRTKGEIEEGDYSGYIRGSVNLGTQAVGTGLKDLNVQTIFIKSFIQQIFAEHLLCGRHCPRCCRVRYCTKETKTTTFKEMMCSREGR